MKRILKKIWHDLYLAVTLSLLRPLYMTCKQATDHANTQTADMSLLEINKYKLHLSICSACVRYAQYSQFIFQNYINNKTKIMTEDEIKVFNKKLITKVK